MSNIFHEQMLEYISETVGEVWQLHTRPDLEKDCLEYVLDQFNLNEDFSKDDDFIIDKMAIERANWSNIFGKENSSLLNLHWDYVYRTWKNLYKNDLNSGTIVPCHFDMHPHNLIVNDGEVVAVLDFDSCKKIPLGYSLAFNTLKQCRQFLSLSKNNNSYKEVVDVYLKNLINMKYHLDKHF